MKKPLILQFSPFAYENHVWWVEKVASFFHSKNSFKDYLVETVCFYYKSKPLPEWYIWLPGYILFWHYSIPALFSLQFWKKIRELVRKKPFIVITHTRFFMTSLLGWFVAKITWATWLHIEHWSWFVKGYPFSIRFFAYIYDWSLWLFVFRSSNSIVWISNATKRFVSKFTKKQIAVIYNPIDFIPQKRTESIDSIVHIWFIWRLVSLKWVNILLESLWKLQWINRKCTIVWSGPEYSVLKNLCHSLGITDNVTFFWRDDRKNWLHKFDIFVNPSYQEWLPTSVVEALRAGCSVIATDVWWTAEISDAITLFQPWNVDQLAWLLTREIVFCLEEWGCWWISNSLDQFDWNTAINAYEKLFTTIKK